MNKNQILSEAVESQTERTIGFTKGSDVLERILKTDQVGVRRWAQYSDH